MRAEIIDPRTEPVPEAWEKLRDSQGLPAAWNPQVLTALAWSSQRTIYLGLVSDGDVPVALFTGEFGPYSPRKPEYSTPGRPSTGLYFCRLPAGLNEGFAFAGALDDKDRRQACRTFERGLRDRLGLRCFGIVYRNVTAATVGIVDGWFRLSRPVSPAIVLHNAWTDMDGYFADLPRSRRRAFSDIYRRVDESTEIETVSGADSIDPDQASQLDAAIRRKYLGGREVLVPLPHSYFSRLNRRPSVRYFIHRSLSSGLVESFDLAFIGNGVLSATFTGSRETPLAKRLRLYHDLYLREIAYMIEHGLHTVEFGKGLFDLKRRFGCVQVTQYAVAAAF